MRRRTHNPGLADAVLPAPTLPVHNLPGVLALTVHGTQSVVWRHVIKYKVVTFTSIAHSNPQPGHAHDRCMLCFGVHTRACSNATLHASTTISTAHVAQQYGWSRRSLQTKSMQKRYHLQGQAHARSHAPTKRHGCHIHLCIQTSTWVLVTSKEVSSIAGGGGRLLRCNTSTKRGDVQVPYAP